MVAMDEKRPFPNRENFIIRLWQRDSDPTTWVGQVQHVGSGTTAAVHNLDELTAVVAAMLVKAPVLSAVEAPVSTPST